MLLQYLQIHLHKTFNKGNYSLKYGTVKIGLIFYTYKEFVSKKGREFRYALLSHNLLLDFCANKSKQKFTPRPWDIKILERFYEEYVVKQEYFANMALN